MGPATAPPPAPIMFMPPATVPVCRPPEVHAGPPGHGNGEVVREAGEAHRDHGEDGIAQLDGEEDERARRAEPAEAEALAGRLVAEAPGERRAPRVR